MKQKNSKHEYVDVWDSGTYQTGNATPPKKSNPLVAILLMLVIFLGGIASAMGIVNLRLLAALRQQQPTETLPVHLEQDLLAPTAGNSNLETAPSIPDTDVSMKLEDSDSLPEQEVNAPNAVAPAEASCVRISVSENGTGNGLVITENGFILTHTHLVEGAERIYVTLSDGTRHRASLVGCDAYSDLAVLYIRAGSLTPALFCGKADFAAGEKVTALCGNLTSGGTVFASDKHLQIADKKLALLKTSAATGEEAGFLLGSNGQVLGIISPRFSQYLGCTGEGLAYVIPSTVIKTVVDQLLRHGFVFGRPGIGATVEEVTDLYQNYWQLPDGLRITTVTNSALEEGDILISINGQRLTNSQDLYNILLSCRIGQKLEAVVYRDGRRQTISLFVNEEHS